MAGRRRSTCIPISCPGHPCSLPVTLTFAISILLTTPSTTPHRAAPHRPTPLPHLDSPSRHLHILDSSRLAPHLSSPSRQAPVTARHRPRSSHYQYVTIPYFTTTAALSKPPGLGDRGFLLRYHGHRRFLTDRYVSRIPLLAKSSHASPQSPSCSQLLFPSRVPVIESLPIRLCSISLSSMAPCCVWMVAPLPAPGGLSGRRTTRARAQSPILSGCTNVVDDTLLSTTGRRTRGRV